MCTKGEKALRTAAFILRLLNGLYAIALFLILLGAAAFSGYVLWDSRQVLQSTRELQTALQDYRPSAADAAESAADGGIPEEPKRTDAPETAKENASSFQALQALNPDICAWLSLPGTEIDLPVLQGRDNIEYLSKDAYGNYHLAGSVFLDTRISRQFADPYLLLYGHNVENGVLFADLLKYRDETFFAHCADGRLILPDRTWSLHPFACFQTEEREPLVFDPEYAAENLSLLLDYAGENAEQADSAVLSALRADGGKILAMTTCTNGSDEDARTVVLARMEELP